jgi:hypothetical protein
MLSSGRLNRFGTSAWSKPMAFHAKVVRVFTRVLESRRSRHPSESRWHRAVAPGVEVGEITTHGLALSGTLLSVSIVRRAATPPNPHGGARPHPPVSGWR